MTAIEKKKKELGARKFGRMILDKTISAEKSSESSYVVQAFSSKRNTIHYHFHPKSRCQLSILYSNYWCSFPKNNKSFEVKSI